MRSTNTSINQIDRLDSEDIPRDLPNIPSDRRGMSNARRAVKNRFTPRFNGLSAFGDGEDKEALLYLADDIVIDDIEINVEGMDKYDVENVDVDDLVEDEIDMEELEKSSTTIDGEEFFAGLVEFKGTLKLPIGAMRPTLMVNAHDIYVTFSQDVLDETADFLDLSSNTAPYIGRSFISNLSVSLDMKTLNVPISWAIQHLCLYLAFTYIGSSDEYVIDENHEDAPNIEEYSKMQGWEYYTGISTSFDVSSIAFTEQFSMEARPIKAGEFVGPGKDYMEEVVDLRDWVTER